MIVKELRDSWWAILVGLLIVVLSAVAAAATDLSGVTLAALHGQSDASFSAVASGRMTAAAAYLWATFFADTNLYFLVGLGGALFGARLIASESSSGSLYLLLSRPVGRARALLTKYGVAAGLLLALTVLCAALVLVFSALNHVAAPPLGGLALSALLFWLAMLFVLGITTVYSVLLPSGLAAGILGFITVYVISIAPLFHIHTPSLPGGDEWSLPTYWSSLDIYAGVASPARSLLVSAVAALIPFVAAVLLFGRRAY